MAPVKVKRNIVVLTFKFKVRTWLTEFFWAASIWEELEDATLLFGHHALVGGANLHPMFASTCFTVIRVPVASMRVGVTPMKTAPLC